MTADYSASETSVPSSVEKAKDFGAGPRGKVSRYVTEIALYEQTYRPWESRVEKIIKRYRDERVDADKRKKFNILWSNVETLKPAIYARAPVPDIQRRYKSSDPIGRAAAMVLERATSYTVDQYNLNGTLELCLMDYLLGGRAQGWVRYEYEQEDKPGLDGKMVPTVTHEKACLEHVVWKDFGHNVARTWPEVYMVWRCAYLTYDKLKDKFGDDIAKKVPLDTAPKQLSEEQRKQHGQTFKTAKVYEIWDKEAKEVLWICKGYPDAPLKADKPPINFDGFFPCPEPLYASMTTDTLIPIPDYGQYQDQAVEIDALTERISLLVSAIKVAGLYDGSMKDKLGQVLDLTGMVMAGEAKNVLIPVDSWAAFAEKGGMKGSIDFMPLDQITNAAVALYEAREKAKQELYEVSGMADVIRGATDPDETAAAQKIKGRFGAMRLETRQARMANFARGLIRLGAEVIAEQFLPETLQAMTGIEMPMAPPPPPDPMAPMLAAPQIPPQMQQIGSGSSPGTAGVAPQNAGPNDAQAQAGAQAAPPAQPPVKQPTWLEVIALLRDDLLRGFRIDIETDSTIAMDEQAEKEAATELMNVATPFLEKMAQAAVAMPAMLPLLGEVFMQVIRRFKLGRNIEQTFEETIEQLKGVAKQQKPSPEEQKLEIEKQRTEQELAANKIKGEQEMMLKGQETTARIDADNRKAENDIRLANIKAENDEVRSVREHEHNIALAKSKDEMERGRMDHQNGLEQDRFAMEYDIKEMERESESEEENMADPSKPKRIGPMRKMEEMMNGHAQNSSSIQQAIAQQTATLSQMSKVQQTQQAQMMQLIDGMRQALLMLAQPKSAKPIRGKDGRIVDVIVGPAGNA